MDDLQEEADVFAVPDFWKTSSWLDNLVKKTPTPFFPQDLQDIQCHDDSRIRSLPIVAAEEDGFFKLPVLDASEHADDLPAFDEPSLSSLSVDLDRDERSDNDIWSHTEERKPKRPRLRTWDAFINEDASPFNPLLISYGGSAAFDALLAFPEDRLKLGNPEAQVADVKVYFSSLLALALGRESVLFQKTGNGNELQPVLPNLRISGYSRGILKGIERRCGKVGLSYTSLQAFVQSTFRLRKNRCGVALASAVDQVLQVVQQYLAMDGCAPSSLLQLQSTIEKVSSLVQPLDRLVMQVTDDCSDEAILCIVHQHVCNNDSGTDHFPGLIREIFAIVSRPWIQSLEEWLGTRTEEGIPLSLFDKKGRKTFVKVEGERFLDDFGEEVEEVDYQLDLDKVPWFLPKEVAETTFETGRNLRFIKSFHPEHPLAQEALIQSCRPPPAEWQYDWDKISALEKRARQYQQDLCIAISASAPSQSSLPRRMKPQQLEPNVPELQFFGLEPAILQDQFQVSLQQLDQCQPQVKSPGALNEITLQQLRSSDHGLRRQLGSTSHWSDLPTFSLATIANTQARVVNRESLKLLFREHGLRRHLDLQNTFQLLGSGLFSTRLSQTLFDPGLETAERKSGVARQGGVMGLRLGSRDTWPPASSELRLALMGLLTETYELEYAKNDYISDARSNATNDVPGDMSFAVRDLSPEDIDKCMDPDTLEAMDFLRLAYKAPKELRDIITPTILIKYDQIFKHLLRVMRMLYVGSQLFSNSIKDRTEQSMRGDNSKRFIREANHFISCVAAYSFDIGIGASWKPFCDKLDQVERALTQDDGNGNLANLKSPSQLGALHLQTLDKITTSLFLRKRQQPVLRLMEDVFNHILRFAKLSRSVRYGDNNHHFEHDQAAKLYGELARKMHVFLTVCRGIAEKSRTASKKAGGGINSSTDEGSRGENMVAQLVEKLDGYNYYKQR